MRLRYTREAIAELAQVLEGIAEHSPQGARRIRSRIRKAVDLLAAHPPGSCSPYPYLIFYRVTEKELVVVGIRHAARNPTTMPDAP